MSNILVITEQDGKQREVSTTLEDRLAFEQALRKNKGWGKLEDNALKLHPFMAYNAARRGGDTRTWAEFTTGDTAAASVEPKKVDEDPEEEELEVEGVGKDTPKAPSTTSPSRSPENTGAPRGSGGAKKSRS